MVPPEMAAVDGEFTLDFEVMSKDELEDYGRTIGIELDRRHSKKKLIQQLEVKGYNSRDILYQICNIITMSRANQYS